MFNTSGAALGGAGCSLSGVGLAMLAGSGSLDYLEAAPQLLEHLQEFPGSSFVLRGLREHIPCPSVSQQEF